MQYKICCVDVRMRTAVSRLSLTTCLFGRWDQSAVWIPLNRALDILLLTLLTNLMTYVVSDGALNCTHSAY